MEKLIARASYWFGIACLAVAIAWRVGNIAGLWLPPASGRGISYWSFYHGCILFFVTSIASACCAWLSSQNS